MNLIKFSTGKSMVFTNDPSAFEAVFRNEGRYPVKTKELSYGVSRLIRKAGHEPSFVNM